MDSPTKHRYRHVRAYAKGAHDALDLVAILINSMPTEFRNSIIPHALAIREKFPMPPVWDKTKVKSDE